MSSLSASIVPLATPDPSGPSLPSPTDKSLSSNGSGATPSVLPRRSRSLSHTGIYHAPGSRPPTPPAHHGPVPHLDTATTNLQLQAMRDEMAHLGQQFQEQAAEHYQQIQTLTTAKDHELNALRSQLSSLSLPSVATSNTHTLRLKASDFPKFGGRDNENVDDWIAKVSAIAEYSGLSDRDLLQQLPLLLINKASTWFTNLGHNQRSSLSTWKLWQDALCNAFYMPNHRATLRRQCLYRTLQGNESFTDYFHSKTSLQHYVYPDGTPTSELIDDLVAGLPVTMHPLVKAGITPAMTLENFRRHLMDLEPGLRMSRSQPRSNNRSTYNNSVPATQVSTRPSAPRTPCTCGGMHWRKDCPTQHRPAAPNFGTPQTPTPTSGSPAYRPPQKSFGNTSLPRFNPPRGSANATPTGNNVRWTPRPPAPTANTVRPTSLSLVSSGPLSPSVQQHVRIRPKDATPSIPSLGSLSLETPWKDKTPVFAWAHLNSPADASVPRHQVCIDTGASISIMDATYARKHLPNVRPQIIDRFELCGLGSVSATSWIEVDFVFTSDDGLGDMVIPAAVYLVPNLPTKIILGNDLLKPMGATINLQDEQLTFSTRNGIIPISCQIPNPPLSPANPPLARIAEAFTLLPGHQARVLVTIDQSSLSTYIINPKPIGQYCHVARTVGTASDPTHFAHIMHVGDKPITLKPGLVIGHLSPAICSSLLVNNIQTDNTFVAETNTSTFPFEELRINLPQVLNIAPLQPENYAVPLDDYQGQLILQDHRIFPFTALQFQLLLTMFLRTWSMPCLSMRLECYHLETSMMLLRLQFLR
jgi:hypothetical protein